jgi:uroporphyrinogen III methyltransferase / synthase
MNTMKPLAGKRVIITRAVEQARDLKERLENLGATVLLLPGVSFSEPADVTELDQAIHSLESFDWILFTSVNAVRFFAGRRRKLNIVPGERTKPRCAAVGPATASAAAAEGFMIDYVAKEFLGAALAQEMRASLAGKRVVLPRSDRAGRDLPDALKAAGAEVTEVVTYHTGGVGAADPSVVDAMRDGRVDVVSFFSPSAVENLRGEFGAEVLRRLGERGAIAAVGPVTAAALRKAGLPVAILAAEATAESMTTAIVRHFSAPTLPEARPT